MMLPVVVLYAATKYTMRELTEYLTSELVDNEVMTVWQSVTTDLNKLITEVDKIQRELDNILISNENNWNY